MDVVNAARRLSLQSRRVVVVDITVRSVEKVEYVHAELHMPREPVAGLEVDQGGRL